MTIDDLTKSHMRELFVSVFSILYLVFSVRSKGYET